IARDPSTSSRSELRATFQTRPMLPYYLLMELPEEDSLSFLLMQPFTPLDRPNMSAFVVAKSGPLSEYGRLIEYTMPRDRQIDGPGQVGDFIDQDPIASAEFTLLGQEGSEVIRGNMLVVPIEDSLLYVQPIYLAADTGGSGIPQFKRVVASFNSRIEIGQTLDQVLIALFGEPGGGTDPGDGGTDPGDGGTDPGDGTVEEQIARLLDLAALALAEADLALRSGDLGTYQDRVEEAAGYIEQANELAQSQGSGESDTTGESASFSR
nr:UPF0182 family protein [Acidimicrobiia bacterium]